MEYIISETKDGRFIVQRTNRLGGLATLVDFHQDCRDTVVAFGAIAEDWLNGDMHREFTVKVLLKSDPDNAFTN